MVAAVSEPLSTPDHRRLHGWFAAAAVACAGLLGVAVWQQGGRAQAVTQRLVPALGVVDRCESCHEEPKHPAYVVDKHPPDRFGCTPCHGGLGLATTAEGAHRASPSWERPLLAAAERDAACGACHTGRDAPIASVATGRRAMAARGCTGCHAIPGVPEPDLAPELDGLRDAVSPGFVRAWLRDPEAIDPRHRMPTFRLAPAEIEALLAHLWTLPGPQLLSPPAGAGDPDRGRSVVAQRRCATCHRIDGRGGDVGPDLALAGSKLAPAWLWNLLTDTLRMRPHTRMPGFRLTADEAADVVALAANDWLPDSGEAPWHAMEKPPNPALAPAGRRLFAELGCGGCHRVAGQLLAPAAISLAAMGDRLLADLPRAPTATPGDVPTWIAQKLLRPTGFDAPGLPPSRMPLLPRLQPDEALAIGIALASLRTQPPPEPWLRHHEPAPAPLPAGETGRLLARFRCLVCHSLAGQGGDVARIALDGAGSRLQRGWLEAFLQAPVTVRMDQAERMPVLGVAPEEAAQLAAWIATALGDDRVPLADAPSPTATGATLYARHGCADCHVAAGAGTMRGPTLDGAAARLQPGYVLALLQDPAVAPARRHGALQLSPADARAVAAYVLGLPGAAPSPPASP